MSSSSSSSSSSDVLLDIDLIRNEIITQAKLNTLAEDGSFLSAMERLLDSRIKFICINERRYEVDSFKNGSYRHEGESEEPVINRASVAGYLRSPGGFIFRFHATSSVEIVCEVLHDIGHVSNLILVDGLEYYEPARFVLKRIPETMWISAKSSDTISVIGSHVAQEKKQLDVSYPYTYNEGFSFKTTKDITKDDLVRLCELLDSQFAEVGIGYEFKPEPITEGGIIFDSWPGKTDGQYKTFRFHCSRHLFPRVSSDTVMTDWKGDNSVVFPNKTNCWTWLKAFYGAPCWTLDELDTFAFCLSRIGFKTTSRYKVTKKSLRTSDSSYLGKPLTKSSQ